MDSYNFFIVSGAVADTVPECPKTPLKSGNFLVLCTGDAVINNYISSVSLSGIQVVSGDRDKFVLDNGEEYL